MSKLMTMSAAFVISIVIGCFLVPRKAVNAQTAPSSCARDCARSCQTVCVGRRCGLECEKDCSRLCAPCGPCLTFEPPLAPGAQYGAATGVTPGSVVLASGGVSMAVDTFEFPSGGTTFGVATVSPPSTSFGSGQVLNSNNINLVFDYAGAGFAPSEVRLEFLDLGGVQNLSVNGVKPFIGRLTAAPPVLGGATVSVFTAPLAGGVTGVLLLRGSIKSFAIGGQEFWVDNVCAKP